MKWRPEDWENPYALKKGQIGITDPLALRVLLKNAFEAGAVLMMERLKTSAKEKQYSHGEDGTEHFEGWLVFIPCEDNECEEKN